MRCCGEDLHPQTSNVVQQSHSLWQGAGELENVSGWRKWGENYAA